jgi:hypothetical protein
MDQRPEYFRPALIAGLAAGVLSGLPFIGIGNCVCCLWIIGGAAVAAKMLAASTPVLVTPGDGAIVGVLTGIVAAVADAIISIPLRPFNLGLARRLLDKAAEIGGQMPSGLQDMLNQSGGILSPGWFLLGLLVSAAAFAAVGALGGVIGVALFAKKGRPPAVPPPGPAIPPAPPSGPSDAA